MSNSESNNLCPVCEANSSEAFFKVSQQPVLIGLKCDSKESALNCPKGDIVLHVCAECAFIWNVKFDPDAIGYNQLYENSLHFSGVFREYTTSIVDRLVDSYDIKNKVVLDIGCGKGDFVAELCEKGNNSGYGFDPSYEGERIQTAAAKRIIWNKDYFNPATFTQPVDLITSRFVLEHIPQPRAFLQNLRESLSNSETRVYFEVPDIDLILRQESLWDIIYEHCSYFGPASLVKLFEETQFGVLDVRQGYAKQFVSVDAHAGKGADVKQSESVTEVLDLARQFGVNSRKTIDDWGLLLADWASQNRRVVLWGAGAKTVGFVNMLDDASEIHSVVDINPHKVGHFVPGTGHGIYAVDELKNTRPDVVVIMNPVYRQEIETQLQSMGLSPQLEVLY